MTIEETRQRFDRIEKCIPGDRAKMRMPGATRVNDLFIYGTVKRNTKTQVHVEIDSHGGNVAIFRKSNGKGIGDTARFFYLVDVEAKATSEAA